LFFKALISISLRNPFLIYTNSRHIFPMDRKLRSRRGSGIADQVLQNVQVGCEVKIICEGKEVMMDQTIDSPSPRGNGDNPKPAQELEDQRNDSFSCLCFKPKFV
jgi:hypothetical protein